MGFDQRLANRQTETQTAELGSAALLEGVKDFRQRVALDSAAGILNFELKLSGRVIAASDGELALIRRKLDGVFNQVPKNLLKPSRIRAEMDLTGV